MTPNGKRPKRVLAAWICVPFIVAVALYQLYGYWCKLVAINAPSWLIQLPIVTIIGLLGLSSALAFRCYRSRKRNAHLTQQLTKRLAEAERATEKQKKLELQLLRAGRKEAIDTLSEGISHDLNNLLLPILGLSSMLRSRFCDETTDQHLNMIVASAEKARGILQKILVFGSDTPQELVAMDLTRVMHEATDFLRALVPSTVVISTAYTEQPLWIKGEQRQLDQVLVNLCINAAQAMPDGGELTLGLSRQNGVEVGDEDNQCSVDAACITVRDTGYGMDQELITRIFDPYFTTKEQSTDSGTGLGLTVVSRMVEVLGGAIVTESQKGIGTTFRLYFPLTEAANELLDASEEYVAGGQGRILVVDDEEMVAMSVSVMLGELGYAATRFTSSIEAERHFAEAPDNYDLVLTDLTLPEMSGPLLAARIRRLRPDIPIVLSSGLPKVTVENRSMFAAIVRKPYSLLELGEEIRRALSTSPQMALMCASGAPVTSE